MLQTLQDRVSCAEGWVSAWKGMGKGRGSSERWVLNVGEAQEPGGAPAPCGRQRRQPPLAGAGTRRGVNAVRASGVASALCGPLMPRVLRALHGPEPDCECGKEVGAA